jgi:hypothetical protein
MDANAHKIITVGQLKMTLPAFITAVCGFVAAVVISWKVNIMVGLVVLPSFFIASYNVNCATVGHCTTWAWILTTLYVIYVLFAVGAVFVSHSINNTVFNKLPMVKKYSR